MTLASLARHIALPGAVASCIGLPDALPAQSDDATTGGATTVPVTGRNAFSLPAANLDQAERTRFVIGNSFFRRNWIESPSSTAARDGLGPLFIARSCGGCHDQAGRGVPPAARNGRNLEQPVGLLLRLSIPGDGPHGGPNPEPVYGDQLTNAAVRGVPVEGLVQIQYRERGGRFADGTRYSLRDPQYRITGPGYGPLHPQTMIGPRIAQQLIGVGLLEAIPENDILAYAHEQASRADDIRGIPNRVWDAVAQQSVLGRFGWKANAGSLAHQVAAAFQADMGITSRYFPAESCRPTQRACLDAPRGGKDAGPEIDDAILANVIFFQSTLATPAHRSPDDPQVRKGGALFHLAGCDVCHRPIWRTGTQPDPAYSSPAVAMQEIHPYTDLLLHDLGQGLADGRPDYLASGSQWRTAPLWGIGLIHRCRGVPIRGPARPRCRRGSTGLA
jgi:CxxC motif-containing protein (DUF1111 family)